MTQLIYGRHLLLTVFRSTTTLCDQIEAKDLHDHSNGEMKGVVPEGTSSEARRYLEWTDFVVIEAHRTK